jgi:hypothetical protein
MVQDIMFDKPAFNAVHYNAITADGVKVVVPDDDIR